MSDLRQDFILDENGDFPLEDTIIGGVYLPTPYEDSDDQHKIDCILYTKGSLKQFPTSGFGLIQYEKSEYDADNVFSNLSEQMSNDGYFVTSKAIKPVSNGGFTIDTDLIQSQY